MTGRPYSRPRPSENDPIDADFAGNRSFEAEEAARKRDLDVGPKDTYEPQNKRGTGTEREYPQDENADRNNENVEGDRGAA